MSVLGDSHPLGKLTIAFPGPDGYITLSNDGETTLHVRWPGANTEVEIEPGHRVPVFGGSVLHPMSVVSKRAVS